MFDGYLSGAEDDGGQLRSVAPFGEKCQRERLPKNVGLHG